VSVWFQSTTAHNFKPRNNFDIQYKIRKYGIKPQAIVFPFLNKVILLRNLKGIAGTGVCVNITDTFIFCIVL
jgi:hypothetical protein